MIRFTGVNIFGLDAEELNSHLPIFGMNHTDHSTNTTITNNGAVTTPNLELDEAAQPIWAHNFIESFDQEYRWKTRKHAINAITLLSLTQKRCPMLDPSMKGGKSLILRCSSHVRYESRCPFYCKLRVSDRDGMWYICPGLNSNHNCPPDTIPPRFSNVDGMLEFHYFMIQKAVEAPAAVEDIESFPI